ncbi:hypothetical protein CRG98_045074 [Punica granatum]|uniref:Uncharacterized protein n=1 Tax=Punica granatum TaxID=22663 RepID=A0A2I0HS59_PUNGR|nr:hypothetical protein CRG98_045074 [Punica granatum]
MNSASFSSSAIVSGASTTSRSTLPPTSRPGKAEIFPSNLFAQPLLIARGRPHPKSLLYIGNLGELPIVIDAPSAFPRGNSLGELSQSAMPFRTVSSPWATTFLCRRPADQLSSRDSSSPAAASVGMLCMAFPK